MSSCGGKGTNTCAAIGGREHQNECRAWGASTLALGGYLAWQSHRAGAEEPHIGIAYPPRAVLAREVACASDSQIVREGWNRARASANRCSRSATLPRESQATPTDLTDRCHAPSAVLRSFLSTSQPYARHVMVDWNVIVRSHGGRVSRRAAHLYTRQHSSADHALIWRNQ